MEGLFRDLRRAMRVFAGTPGLTSAAVLCLGLGIGASGAVFSVVDAVLLRALPYHEPDRLAMIWGRRNENHRVPASAAELVDYRGQGEVFASVGGMAAAYLHLTGDGDPERLAAAQVSTSLFPLLGARAELGRTFTPDEEQPGRHYVAVLSDGLWHRRFGGERGVVGRKLILGGEPYTVIGVMPRSFRFRLLPVEPDLFVPLVIDPTKLLQRNNRYLSVAVRLRQGIALPAAQSALDALAARFVADDPRAYAEGFGINLVPLREQLVGGVRLALLVLFGIVGLVLAITCANVANLLLARATVREREVALCAALGQTRGGVVRQFLVEALVLAAFGGCLGLLFTWAALDVLAALAPEDLSRSDEIALDGRGIVFTLVVTLATVLLCGLLPALRAARVSAQDVLKDGDKSSSSADRHRLRGALMIAEVAFALTVLVGAGLVARSFYLLSRVDPGFRTEDLLAVEIGQPPSKVPLDPRWGELAEQLAQRLRGLPGVEQAGFVSALPLGEIRVMIGTVAEGQPLAPGEQPLMSDWRSVGPSFFDALDIPLRAGRTFDHRDQAGTPAVAVVNEALTGQLWADRNPVGQRFKLIRADGRDEWITVVGVVGEVRTVGLDAETSAQIYTPFAQVPRQHVAFVLRGSDTERIAAQVRPTVWSVDGDLTIDHIEPMRQLVDASISGRRAYAVLLALFAVMALLLAVVGVYGVAAYSVSQRVKEIGIRMALGARRVEILSLVLWQAMLLAGTGVILGMLAAFWTSRYVRGLLFGIGTADLATFLAASLLLLAAVLLATGSVAWRAMQVDPVAALRR